DPRDIATTGIILISIFVIATTTTTTTTTAEKKLPATSRVDNRSDDDSKHENLKRHPWPIVRPRSPLLPPLLPPPPSPRPRRRQLDLTPALSGPPSPPSIGIVPASRSDLVPGETTFFPSSAAPPEGMLS
ncbi:MAG: hypothetical protein M1815_001730, partial [Lichina confinis]